MKTVLFIGIFLLGVAHAAGGEGSVLDLKWPFVNFVLLFSFLAWKIRRPLIEMFDKNADQLRQIHNLAKEKDKEAQIKLETYQKKIQNVNNDCNDILERSQDQKKKFSEEHKRETDQLIERLKQDAANKIEFEKKRMMREINKLLVEQIITKTKKSIKSNEGLRHKATKCLLAQVN